MWPCSRSAACSPRTDGMRTRGFPTRVNVSPGPVVGGVGLRRLGVAEANADASYSMGLWSLIATEMGIEGVVRQTAPAGYHPTRSAEILIDGTVVGAVGELSPAAARRLDLPGRVAVGEIETAMLLAVPRPTLGGVPLGVPTCRLRPVFPRRLRNLPPATWSDRPPTRLGGSSNRRASSTSSRTWPRARRRLAIRYRLRADDRTLTSRRDRLGADRHDRAAASALGAELRGA
jgi:phenylalanyl-tRNA synthetase beta chain